MKKNILISFLLIFFAAVYVSADNGWHVPASADDLEGRWEVEFSINIPENNNVMLPKSAVASSIILECNSEYFALNMIFNMDRFLTDLLDTPQMRQMGFTKETLWGNFLHGMFSEDAGSEFDIFVRDYNFIFSLDGEISELLPEGDNQSNVYINEKKNMIKLVFDEVIYLGLGDEGFSEVFMNKR